MSNRGNRSKSGTLTINPERFKGIFEDNYYSLELESGLILLRGNYGTEAQANLSAKGTANGYGINLEPIKRMTKQRALR